MPKEKGRRTGSRRRGGVELHNPGLRVKSGELAALYSISRAITSSLTLNATLDLIVRQVRRSMDSRICVVHLLDERGLVFKSSAPKNGLSHDLKDAMSLGGGFIGACQRNKRSYLIKDLWQYPSNVFYRLARKYAVRSLVVVPLVEKGDTLGTISVFGEKPGAYSVESEKELKLFASIIAITVENAKLFENTKASYFNTMRLLASIIDAKDEYTENHSKRVVNFATGIAGEMGLDEGLKDIIKYASFLHDIGKISVDAGILKKTGALTEEEWEKIKEHPKVGADIIANAGFLDELVPIILYHHVRYVGGGYPPCKKKGDDIPIGARILSVADAYEAMTSDRPYRRHMGRSEAVKELKRCSGTQFDPKVIKAFLKFLRRGKDIS